MADNTKKTNPLILTLLLSNSILVAFILWNQINLKELKESQIRQASVVVKPKKHLDSKIPVPREGHILEEYKLKLFSENLTREKGPQRYVRTKMVLLVDTHPRRPLEEVKVRTPNIRDRIVRLLNDKTPEELVKLEGKEVLKNQLVQVLNEMLENDKISYIYFLEFQII